MTLQEQRDIIQAAIDGKEIEYKTDIGEWEKKDTEIYFAFNFHRFEYRVKPVTATAPWGFDDYLEHADCWYSDSSSPHIKTPILGFDVELKRMKVGANTYHFPSNPIYKTEDLSYSPTPNGEFKPCVKEVIEEQCRSGISF